MAQNLFGLFAIPGRSYPFTGRPVARTHRPVVSRPAASGAAGACVALPRNVIDAMIHRLEESLEPNSGTRILLLTSARDGEGKTTVLSALARSWAREGRRLLIIDGSECGDASDATAGSGGRALNALLADTKPSEPIVHLSLRGDDRRVQAVLRDDEHASLRQGFDYILVELPARAASAAVIRLARLADGVIVVVEANRTRWPLLERLQVEIEAAKGTVAGAILNKHRQYMPKASAEWL